MIRTTIAADTLARALNGGVAARNSTMPILNHVLIEAGAGRLVLTTNDTEATAVVHVEAAVECEGSVCVPDAQLRAALTGGGNVRIEQDDQCVLVRRGARGRIRLPSLPGQDFPLSDVLAWHDTGIDPLALARALDLVSYAADPSHHRPFGRAVAIRRTGVFASNGYRAARTALPEPYDGPDLLIPITSLVSVRRCLASGAVVQYATVGKSPDVCAVRVVTANLDRVEVRVIATQYPAIEAVFPAGEPAARARLQVGALRTAVARLSPFSDLTFGKDNGRITAAVLEIGNDSITLAAPGDKGLEDLTEALAGSSAWGAARAGIRLDDLARILDSVPGESVDVESYGGSVGVWLVRAEDGADSSESISTVVRL